MLIPTLTIIESLKKDLFLKSSILHKQNIRPKICTILIGDSKEQESFVSIKKRIGEEVGCLFEFHHLNDETSQDELERLIIQKNLDDTIHGIIVQEPLPAHISGERLYSKILKVKEIEHHRSDSPYLPPIGLATLTGYLYTISQDERSFLLSDKQLQMLKTTISQTKIIVVGKGITGGGPVITTLKYLNIPCQVVSSKTNNAIELINNADTIITAVGKKVIEKTMLKKGVILLNLGLHHDGKRLRGDYFEEEIQDVASYYTKTPGGLGPIDVLYLYNNLIEAAGAQNNISL